MKNPNQVQGSGQTSAFYSENNGALTCKSCTRVEFHGSNSFLVVFLLIVILKVNNPVFLVFVFGQTIPKEEFYTILDYNYSVDIFKFYSEMSAI